MSISSSLKAISSRVPIWTSQAQTVLREQGLAGFIKRAAKKTYRFALARSNPLRLHKLQYADWRNGIEAKYLDAKYMKGLNARIKKRVKFSIIMPAWNKKAEMYRKAFDSITNQVYDNWEVCVSDGSTKYVAETEALLKKYKKNLGERMKLTTLEDRQEGKINIIENSNKCIEMATGDFLVFMDCDDEISPNCLLELAAAIQDHPDVGFIYSDFDKIDTDQNRFDPSFWPDWSPHTILSIMYTTHVTCYRRELVEEVGRLRVGTEGPQDWDLVLRVTEKLKPSQIIHIPKILYHWRMYPGSTALPSSGAKNWAYENQRVVLSDWMLRNNLKGDVLPGAYEGAWRIRFDIIGEPKVSIIIPFRDKVQLVKACVASIEEHTNYHNYEIVLVDNQSSEKETLDWLDKVQGKYKLLRYESPYSFGKLNNWAAKQVDGEHLLLLNNDTKVINDEWLSAMLEYSQKPEVGAVGAKLYYKDGSIQHAGIVVGMGGAAAHPHRLISGDDNGYNGWLVNVVNFLAVTGACLMIKRELFLGMGGFDDYFDPAYQDVDLGIRLYEAGYWNVFTPYSRLIHYESLTRFDKKIKKVLTSDEENAAKLRERWPKYVGIGYGNDPFYNPNLSYDHEDMRMRVR